jgi:hypothetical protein
MINFISHKNRPFGIYVWMSVTTPPMERTMITLCIDELRTPYRNAHRILETTDNSKIYCSENDCLVPLWPEGWNEAKLCLPR